jgi:hypothetical protein
MKRKKTTPKITEAEEKAIALARSDLYASAAREAVTHGETDRLVRHIMGAGLAQGDMCGEVLSQDLTLIRWCLRKMEDNRNTAEIKLMVTESP